MKTILTRFIKDEFGTVVIEYCLIAFLISIGIIGALSVNGRALVGIYLAISAALAAAV
jgi:Flp pilus assembly pilin Flp